MTITKPPQTNFDDEISLLDIIQFFKVNLIKILFFITFGGILGSLYGKLAAPIYDGSVLIAPAKIAGNSLIDLNIILTELDMNSFYSKETLLACNPSFSKDKNIDYDMSNIIKSSITKDGNLIKLSMNSPNKETIRKCVDNIVNDINANQKIIANPLIESKKNELNILERKLKLAEELREQLNDKQIKHLKTNEQRFAIDILYANIMLNNNSDIKTLLDQINKVNVELSSEQTREVVKALPINIKQKSFPSTRLGLLLGLLLGGTLGVVVIILKNISLKKF
jgi:hypothetical protein